MTSLPSGCFLMVPIEPSPQSALPVSGGSDQPLDHQQNVAPPKKEGLGSVIFGFVLALIALGLPMIGVTVNLWLGAIALAVAFGFMVYGFWKWERSANWNPILRVGTVIFGAMLYFSLIGIQIRTQYKQDHPVQIDPHEHKAGMTISLTGWGSLPPNKVFATINVEPAPPQNAPFHLLLVFMSADNAVDKMQDTRIEKSDLRSLASQTVEMVVSQDFMMRASHLELVNVNEVVVLLPDAVGLGQISRLADVEKLGGQITVDGSFRMSTADWAMRKPDGKKEPPKVPVLRGEPQASGALPLPAPSAYKAVGEAISEIEALSANWQLILGQSIHQRVKFSETARPADEVREWDDGHTIFMEKYVRGKEQEWSGMKPKIQRAFGGAMARMAMVGPSQIVPEQERQEGDDFAEALASADKAEPFSDIENDKENPKRFVPLIDYLKKLHTKLERYPETPMPQ